MAALKVSQVEPVARYDRRYAGVVLISPDDLVLLQRRDNKPGIVNPGGLTLFGGTVDDGESYDDGALRELAEELDLTLDKADVRRIGFVDKTEEDTSITRCALYEARGINRSALRLREGKSIFEGSRAEALKASGISEVCRAALEASSLHHGGD